ncbi:MAG: hypothetical protein JJ864_09365 [Rhizobiaceae bacterium]|nr:hypothetical protein [Rhizobiaceae bacterium]
MLQIIWKAFRQAKSRRRAERGEDWQCDPLAHPVLDRMTPVELGDLPLGSLMYNCRDR